jgi:hypothetical protein
MRSFLACVLCVATAAVAGCTTSNPSDFPDVFIGSDAGNVDSGMDAGLPDPTIDPCEEPGGTLGSTCSTDEQCDDLCYCNGVERCTGGTCAAGEDPCADTIDCTDEACLEETDRCFNMPNHALCSNMLACDGYEQCDRGVGCVAGAPLYCNDESACTVDSCSDTEGCVYTPRDLDRDGYLAGSCGGDDCDDDPRYGTMIYPGAPEVCENRRDDDCDGRRDYNDSDCRPMNDRCDTASIITARTGTYSGSTAGLTSDFTLGCSTATGPDAVFRFTLTEPHDVRASVSGTSSATIALRNFAQCSSGPDLKCNSSSSPSILHRSLPAGDYAIIVRNPSAGPFDLQLMVTDPTPIPAIDLCNTGTQVINASGTFRGRFEETSDDYRLSCHTGSWRDAAYRLELAADSDLVITGTTSGSMFGSSTFISLVTDCSMPTSALQCMSGSTAEIRRRGVPAGVYYILLEASTIDATDWTLNVTITTPPAPRAVGDACSTAVPITFSPGPMMSETGMGSASLGTAELDSGTSCGGATAGSRDLYFYFDLATTRDVTVTTNGAGFHYVGTQTTCGMTGSEIRCRSGSAPLSQIWRSLAPGRYYIAVATTLASGTVTATVETRPPTPIPPNDRCTGAITLTHGTSRRDTLIGFDDDVMGCSGTAFPDAFYTFTLATSRRVLISVSDPAGATTRRFYMTLRSSCASPPNLACSNGTGMTTPPSINQMLTPGTYYLVIESSVADSSDFQIDYFEL